MIIETKISNKRQSIFKYELLVMALTHVLAHALQQIHFALFPVIRSEFNLSLQQLAIIAAIPPIFQSILYIPAGLLSDVLGSKKLILASLCAAASASIIASQAFDPSTLTLAVSLVYINTTIYHPAALSFTSRFFGIRDRVKALGILDAGGSFGIAIGPISLGILIAIFALEWRQIYLFWFVPILFGIFLVFRIRFDLTEDVKEKPENPEHLCQDSSFLNRNLVTFLFFSAIRMMAAQMIAVFLPVYLVDERGLSEVVSSFIYGGISLMGLGVVPLGGFLASRLGEKRWMLIALPLSYVFLAFSIAVPSLLMFVVLYLSYRFCGLICVAADSSITARLSPSRRRGLAYALSFLPMSVVGVIAPIIAAYIAGSFGMTSIFVVALITYATSLAILKFGVKI